MTAGGGGWAVFSWEDGKGGSVSYVFSTADAGAHWIRVHAVPPGQRLFSEVLPDGAYRLGWLPSDGSPPRLYSSDWTWKSLPFSAGDATSSASMLGTFLDGLHGWAATRGVAGLSLWRTADGGKTWSRLAGPTDKLGDFVTGMAFRDAAHGWLSLAFSQGGPALLVTNDGGGSWTPVWLTRPPDYPAFQAIFAPVSSTGNSSVTSVTIAEGSQGVGAPESLYIYTAPHGGPWQPPRLAWSGRTASSGIPILGPAGGAWWLVASGQLALSTDDGYSWTTRSLPFRPGFQVDSANFVTAQRAFIAAIEMGGCTSADCRALFRTDDAGASWTPLALPTEP
jgi:photosystem II stability/assembly factor-like uncharacterized protein